MSPQQLHDLLVIFVMGTAMALLIIVGILKERYREIRAAQEADNRDAEFYAYWDEA